jgi:hypothetical protein
MNIVLDDAVEEKQGGEKVAIGMVVSAAELRDFIPYPSGIYPVALRGTNQLLVAHSRSSAATQSSCLRYVQHHFFIIQTSSAPSLDPIANGDIF